MRKQMHAAAWLAGGFLLALALGSCTPVKAYQKSKINDADMELSARKVEKPESNFQSYKEGASGAGGGKVGGGCGCN
ncbi:MAG TPA: DUF4266 domain-containing protein [Chitinophagaceae bacterium]|nr:DUF4266 domain-containing protein [Chitinophagaceae bacterium]